ncbi:ubiquitin hydrolase [Trypanosoma cruzi]|nr:ubiquitin hydrolase [Trypanosoma cruzi]
MSAPAIRHGGPSGRLPTRQGHHFMLTVEPPGRSFATSATTPNVPKTTLPSYPGMHRLYSRPFRGEPQFLGVSSSPHILPSALHGPEDRRWNSMRSHSHRPPLLSLRGRPPQLQPLLAPSAPAIGFASQASSTSEMQISRTSDRQSPIPLRNFGNTCYMNAIIQCILHSPWLFSSLAETHAWSKRPLATSALLELGAARVDAPGQLLLTVKGEAAKFNAEFQDNGQSDAHEFLRTFLFVVHSEINTSGGHNTPYEELKEVENESEEEAMRRWQEHYLRVDNSIIYDLFGGVMRSRCVCSSCGKVSLTFDPFLDLSLPMIPGARKAATIESMLKISFDEAEEKLRGGNQLLCARCRRLRNGTRSVKIIRWPKILVLHLKRFDDTGKKNSEPVVFPESFMTHGNSPMQYQLYGVVCHSGSENWGHYTSYVRTLSGRWYHCNDAVISLSTVTEAMQALTTAYILFYAVK